MSHKEDESNKIPCPVCGKMISATMGRTVHERSKFHQDALKKQKGGGENENGNSTQTKPKPDGEGLGAGEETKPPETKPPEVKPPVGSGIAGKDKPPAKEKKSGGGIGKFLEDLFGDDDDEDW